MSRHGREGTDFTSKEGMEAKNSLRLRTESLYAPKVIESSLLMIEYSDTENGKCSYCLIRQNYYF